MHGLTERAEEYLEAARSSAEANRHSVAFDEARTACELFCKALLLAKTGTYPRDHNVAGPLYHAGLVPPGLDPRTLSNLLKSHTKGTYGFDDAPTGEDVAWALDIAERLAEHARRAL